MSDRCPRWIAVGAFLADVAIGLNLAIATALAQSGPGFTIEPRPDVSFVAVPVIRPTEPNKPLALDLIPNGSPSEVPNNGITWLDACDQDLIGSPGQPITCARVAITSADARFGVMAFNGAPVGARPVRIISNTRVIATFTALPSPRLVVGAFDSALAARQIAALEARVRALDAEVQRLRRAQDGTGR